MFHQYGLLMLPTLAATARQHRVDEPGHGGFLDLGSAWDAINTEEKGKGREKKAEKR